MRQFVIQLVFSLFPEPLKWYTTWGLDRSRYMTSQSKPDVKKIRAVWLLWCDVMIQLSSYHRSRFVVSTGERSVITLTLLCTTSNGVKPVYFEGLDFSFDISWGWISDITRKSGKFVLISIRCCAAWMPSIFEELNCCTPRAIRGTGISWIPKYAAFL